MNELIKIDSLGYGGVPTVSGRELHDALEIETRYNDWFARMCEYGFVEGEDFYSFLSKSTGGRPSTDHALTLDTAKEICMLQRTEIGRTIRRYFIETEKRYRQQTQTPALSPLYAETLLLMTQKQNELESLVHSLENIVTSFKGEYESRIKDIENDLKEKEIIITKCFETPDGSKSILEIGFKTPTPPKKAGRRLVGHDDD